MNTKGIKFLAVLAVFAMAFAAFAVVTDADDSDAANTTPTIGLDKSGDWVGGTVKQTLSNSFLKNSLTIKETDSNDTVKKYDMKGYVNYVKGTPATSKLGEVWGDDCNGWGADKVGIIAFSIENYKDTDFTYVAIKGFGDASAAMEIADIQEKGGFIFIENWFTNANIADMQNTKFYVYFGGEDLDAGDAETIEFTIEISYKMKVAFLSENVNALNFLDEDWLEEAGLDDATGFADSVTDSKGYGWTYKESGTKKTLTLNNYNNSQYFDYDGLTNVVLAGTNKITLADAPVAISTEENLIIDNDSGVASLSIAMSQSVDYEDLYMAGVLSDDLKVTGVDLDVSITGKGTVPAVGISASMYTVDNSTQTITVLPSLYGEYRIGMDADDAAAGIIAAAVAVQGKSDLTVTAGAVGIYSFGDLAITNSDVSATASICAIAAFGGLSVTQSSEVIAYALGLTANTVSYAIAASTIVNKSYSTIAANGIILSAAGSENYAYIENTGNMVIGPLADFTNTTDGEFNNSGVIGVYGALNVAKGTFSNTGIINVLSDIEIVDEAEIPELTTTDKNKAYVESILIDDMHYSRLADGTVEVWASVQFHGVEAVDDDHLGGFYGIAKVDSEGNIVSLTLTATTYAGDNKCTAKVSLTSSKIATGDNAGKFVYNITSSGKYAVGGVSTDVAGTIKDPKEGEAGIEIADLAAAASFTVAGGEFVNDGVMTVNALKNTAAGYKLITSGKFTNNGILAIALGMTALDEPFTGVNFAGGAFVNSGTMTTDSSMLIAGGTTGSFTGGFTVTEGVIITVNGKIDATVTYDGEYTPEATGATTPSPIAFSDVIALEGKGTGFVVTATEPGTTAGAFTLSALNLADAETDSEITLLAGKGVIDSGNIASKLVITVANDSVMDVESNPTNVGGVIAVQDGATLNYSIEDVPETYVYGDLVYTISFAKDGFTYYGNLAFALANAEEGMVLYLASEETIDSDTVVKKGIQLVFAKDAILNIANATKKIAVSMEEGAAFVLGDNAVINITNAKISGNIEYGDNELSVSNITLANGSFTGIPAEGDELASIELDFAYTDGTVELIVGVFTGEVGLNATLNDQDKVKTYAQLIIDDFAVSEIQLTEQDNSDKAKIALEGTIYIDADTVLYTPITGNGAIYVDDGCSVTLAADVEQEFTILAGLNGFEVTGLFWLSEYDNVAVNPEMAIKFTAMPETSSDDAYMDIYGAVFNGTISTIGNTATSGLILMQDPLNDPALLATLAVEADTVFTVLEGEIVEDFNLDANGVLKVAGTINMYTEDTTDYGAVDYDVTYIDGAYTVYAKLASAAQQAPAGTDFEVTTELAVDTLVLNKGNTITITGKDAALVIGQILIVGNPATSVGATDAIVGKVVLADGAFAIVYDDADVTGAKFVYGADEKAAKTSNYSIANVTYCDVYATEGVNILEDVNPELGVPKISGLKFQGWVKYVTTATDIGQTDVYANTVAVQYKITLTSVEGVVYKVGGSSSVVLDSPFYVDAGTVVNAVAASGYKGTTQTWTVDKDQTITASGFTPVEPEPTPAEKEAFGITEILLVVLVILIAVMVIVVLLRMNRS